MLVYIEEIWTLKLKVFLTSIYVVIEVNFLQIWKLFNPMVLKKLVGKEKNAFKMQFSKSTNAKDTSN